MQLDLTRNFSQGSSHGSSEEDARFVARIPDNIFFNSLHDHRKQAEATLFGGPKTTQPSAGSSVERSVFFKSQDMDQATRIFHVVDKSSEREPKGNFFASKPPTLASRSKR